VPADRWRALIDEHDDRAASALRALLVIDPVSADAALARARTSDAETAERALATLLERDAREDTARIAAFADVAAVRADALDALVAREAASTLLSLASAPDVDVALALARPRGTDRASWLARTPSLVLRAIAGDAHAADCAFTGSADVATRRRAAACLALVDDGTREAAAALETERDEETVSWLAIAAHDQAITPSTLTTLLETESTRIAAITLSAATRRIASAAERRTIDARLVRSTTDLDDAVRAAAVHALGNIGDARHRGVLLRAIDDESPLVRLAAALALPADEPRAVGRAHVEDDPRVLRALRREPLGIARAPLHLRVIEHHASHDGARVRIALADGRILLLAPIDGEVFVPDAPDAPANVELRAEH
jgi:hypothetical protein